MAAFKKILCRSVVQISELWQRKKMSNLPFTYLNISLQLTYPNISLQLTYPKISLQLTYPNIIIIIINPLTVRVVGAPQTILQPVFSIFPCSPLPSGTCQTPACPYPDVMFPPLPLSALSSSPFHCALQDGFGQT